MKKFLALLLALVMVFALAACGGTDSTPSDAPESEAPASEAPADDTPASEAPADDGVITDPNEIPNDAESADGTYEVAFVTDVGQLQDGSFNEGTWNGVKLYAANNGLTYKYYQPANGNEATDDDRVNAMQAAVDAGKAILLVSLELDEVMSLSDRILVMYEGEIVGELDPKKTTVQELGLYMAGAKRKGGKGETA